MTDAEPLADLVPALAAEFWVRLFPAWVPPGRPDCPPRPALSVRPESPPATDRMRGLGLLPKYDDSDDGDGRRVGWVWVRPEGETPR